MSPEVEVLDALDEDVHQALLALGVGLEEDAVTQTELLLGIVLTLTEHDPLVQVDHQHVAVTLVGDVVEELQHLVDDDVERLLLVLLHHHLGERVIELAHLELGIHSLQRERPLVVELLAGLHVLGVHRLLSQAADQRAVVAPLQGRQRDLVAESRDRLRVRHIHAAEASLDDTILHLVLDAGRHLGGSQRSLDADGGIRLALVDQLVPDAVRLLGDRFEARQVIALLSGIHDRLHDVEHDIREGTDAVEVDHDRVAVRTHGGVHHLRQDHLQHLRLRQILLGVQRGGRHALELHDVRQQLLLRRHVVDVEGDDRLRSDHVIIDHTLGVEHLQAVLARTVGAAHQQQHVDGISLVVGQDHPIIDDVATHVVVVVLGEHPHVDRLHRVIQIPPTMQRIGLDEALARNHQTHTVIPEHLVGVLVGEGEASHVDSALVGDDRTEHSVGHRDPPLLAGGHVGDAAGDQLVRRHALDDAIEPHEGEVLRGPDVQTGSLPRDLVQVQGVAQLLHVNRAIVVVGILTQQHPRRDLIVLHGSQRLLDHTVEVEQLLALRQRRAEVDRGLVVPHGGVTRVVLPHRQVREPVRVDLALQVLAEGDEIDIDLVIGHDHAVTLHDEAIVGEADGHTGELASLDGVHHVVTTTRLLDGASSL